MARILTLLAAVAVFVSVQSAHGVELDTDKNGATDIARGGTNAKTAAGARTALGLGAVDNTRDVDKPVSAATQAALSELQSSFGEGNVRISGLQGDGATDNTALYPQLWASMQSEGQTTAYFPPGTYMGSFSAPDGVTLECAPGAVLKLPDGANTHLMTVDVGVSTILKGCVLDGNRAGQTSLSRGIQGYSVGGITLDRTEVRNTHDETMRVDADTDGSTSNGRIRIINKSKLHDAGKGGLWVLEKTDGLEVSNSEISNWGVTSAASDAVLMSMHGNGWIKNVDISDNEFRAVSSNLFSVESVGQIDGIKAINNTMYGQFNGFSFQARKAGVHGNRFLEGQGNWRSGMELILSDSSVYGNHIANGSLVLAATDASLDSMGPPLVSEGVKASFNIIKNQGSANASGAHISGTATNALHHVDFTHNTIDMTGATGSFNGILLGVYGSQGVVHNVNADYNTIIRTDSRLRKGINLNGAAGSYDISLQHETISGFDSAGIDIAATSNHDGVTAAYNTLWDNNVPLSNASTGGVYRIFGNVLTEDQTGFDLGSSAFSTMMVTSNGLGTDPSLGFDTIGSLGGKTGFSQDSEGHLTMSAGGRSILTMYGAAAGTAGTLTYRPIDWATSSNNYNSNQTQFMGACWNGSATAADYWNVWNVVGAGASATSTLFFQHGDGCGGAAAVQFDAAVKVNSGGAAGKAMCWKADGKTLGYCSSVIAADGGCTCN